MYRIAIVEDTAEVNNMFKAWLLEAYPDARIDQFFTFKEATDGFVNNTYDLVLLDVKLPDNPEGGVTLASDMRTRETPALIVSGAAEGEARSLARRYMQALGAWDYLAKPVDQPDLMNQVRHALAWRDKAPSKNATDPDLVLEPLARVPVKWRGKRVHLTMTQIRLVERLVRSIGETVSYDELQKLLPSSRSSGAIPVHLRAIRAAFTDVDPDFRRIKTDAGAGLAWQLPG